MPSASAIRYFGTVAAHEKLPVKPGYCSATDTGSGYACSARERKGFWYASTLEGCAELCEACPKCNYFSFSRNLTDCSWFESCAISPHCQRNSAAQRRPIACARVRGAAACAAAKSIPRRIS